MCGEMRHSGTSRHLELAQLEELRVLRREDAVLDLHAAFEQVRLAVVLQARRASCSSFSSASLRWSGFSHCGTLT
jgi:predicted deacylase